MCGVRSMNLLNCVIPTSIFLIYIYIEELSHWLIGCLFQNTTTKLGRLDSLSPLHLSAKQSWYCVCKDTKRICILEEKNTWNIYEWSRIWTDEKWKTNFGFHMQQIKNKKRSDNYKEKKREKMQEKNNSIRLVLEKNLKTDPIHNN